MVIYYEITFPEKVTEVISKECEDPLKRNEFLFGLKSALFSPFVMSSIKYDEGNDEVTGFIIWKHIYPFHEDFGIVKLDEAMQAVTNQALLALSYIEAIFGAKMVEQEIVEQITKNEPDGMYR